MEVLNELKAKGKIHAIGAANVTAEHIAEYVKWGSLDIVQCKYNLLDRSVEKDILPLCKKHQITLQAYSPLEQGLLTGTISRDYVPAEGTSQRNKFWFQRENMLRVLDMVDAWKPLCEKYQCSIPNLAMAWVLAQSDAINMLSGAVSSVEILENSKAVDIDLSQEDIRLMRAMAESLE